MSNAANTANTKAANAQGGTVASGTTNAATKNNANKTGTTTPSGNNNSGNQSGNQNSNQGGNSQPHQHHWVAQTKTVHHDAEYTTSTISHPAETATVCLTCWNKGITVIRPSSDHLDNHLLNGENDATGPRTVKEAWTETKKELKTAAYDETVTTGYSCSCGATKPAN